MPLIRAPAPAILNPFIDGAPAAVIIGAATATATPPPWLWAAHPEIVPVDVDGHTLWPGSRQAWCPTSPVFREYALALARQLASRYHDHPGLAMWHVSNEYACPVWQRKRGTPPPSDRTSAPWHSGQV